MQNKDGAKGVKGQSDFTLPQTNSTKLDIHQEQAALVWLMTKHALPPCSVKGCSQAAGAIINQALLCSQHAAIEIELLLRGREAVARERSREESQSIP